MGNPALSASVSFLLTIVIVAVGQVFKEQLAASRQGTLLAGTLGSLTFVFALTLLSNLKMIDGGGHVSGAKSGLFDVGIALMVAVIASASIHRVAISLCVIFSCILLFFLCTISNNRYSGAAASAAHSSGGGAQKNAGGRKTK